jgi:hypothetical protein
LGEVQKLWFIPKKIPEFPNNHNQLTIICTEIKIAWFEPSIKTLETNGCNNSTQVEILLSK